MRLVLFFISFCLCFSARATDVSYVDKPWNDIKDLAKTAHKYIMVDCYTQWCGWCKVMDKETMTDPSVTSIINEQFIPVKIDMEHGEGIKLAMKYHVTGYPTFLFFNPQGQLVYVSIGYEKPQDFLSELKNALDKNKQSPATGFSADLDISYPEFYRNAFAGNGKRKFPEDSVVNAFLDGQQDMLSEISWSVMRRFDVNEKYSRFFLDNIQKYEQLYGHSDITGKLNEYLYSRERAALEHKSAAEFEEILKLTDKYVKDDPVAAKLNLRMDFYKESGDWPRFMQAFSDYITIHGYDNIDYINSLCWTMYENCSDKKALSKACVYMGKAVEKEPKYIYMDTYAAILYKAGQPKDAAAWAGKAIEEGRKNGENVSSTEALLKKINVK